MSAPNWLGLLRWSLAYSDGTQESSFSKMSAEDAAWLEKVMKEVVRDDPARMNEIMLSLKEVAKETVPVSEEKAEEIEASLDELRDIVEQVDMAQVLAKFRGDDVLLSVAACVALPAETQALAAAVIATVAQNNLVTQEMFFSRDPSVLSRLVEIYLRTPSFLVANKSLLAISAVIRGHAAAEELFARDFASVVLSRALQSEHSGLVSRALFLAHALISSDYATAKRVETLVAQLLPAAVELIARGTLSQDVRDNLLLLLHALLHTERGWRMLQDATKQEELRQAMETRDRALEREIDSDADSDEDAKRERESEREKLRDLLQAVRELRVVFPHNPSIGAAATTTTTTTTGSEADSVSAPLMIGAPAPSGAPHLP